MAKKTQTAIDIDFAFFEYLHLFYTENKKAIRRHYREPTKLFLDFNDIEKNTNAYLRIPQFEALEMYVFLKEYLKHKPVHQIFDDWYHKNKKFEKRSDAGLHSGEQIDLFGVLDEKSYKRLFSKMQSSSRTYPNYIFALTMGTGKTILMATCIFYEFILASKFPDDPLYCNNALVFAPDKTVLQSLREIEEFDKSKVIPPEYFNFLNTHLQFHYLEDSGVTLNTLDRSQFNIIVSNAQKIILKKKHKEKLAQDMLFDSDKKHTVKMSDVYSEIQDLYGDDTPEDETELTTNQRFNKLCRLENMGIYVDEAHHAFGEQLAKDMGVAKSSSQTSLRITIDTLAVNLQKAGTQVVSCFNYTGTPYVKRDILPEVVYAYGLRKAIDKRYLKTVKLNAYSNPKAFEFIKLVINDFWKNYGENRREGILPKIAFFAATISEITDDLRPMVEQVLVELNIPVNKVLVNVGDTTVTTNDDIREFNRLDKPDSEKQFILLVNKGREGWNCRSLFSVAMFRQPKSRVFVLQATMRCLREIGDIQEEANIYLSEENRQILDDELQQNFRISAEEFERKSNTEKRQETVTPVPPPIKIKINRVRRLYDIKKKEPEFGMSFELENADTEKYRIIHTQRLGLETSTNYKVYETQNDVSYIKDKRIFSPLTLTSEIARYMNHSAIEIEDILVPSKEGMDTILSAVNEFNELIYDWIIPKLFNALYSLIKTETVETEDIDLVKIPESGNFTISANPELIVSINDTVFKQFKDKSFHLDKYCFDSRPEKDFFENIIKSDEINKIWFTGMLTHGQSDFYIHYIDHEVSAVRTYYPDFLIQKKDGTYIIVEVKGDHQIDDPIVQSKKEFAQQMATDNNMIYYMIPSTQVNTARSQIGLEEYFIQEAIF
ncbi:MAG: DEAD/DEAH box helicase family protein [Desulfamplus sp.]|nr:DEAD/DEAH box helicase family protein [Desulfamplus sp.]